MSQRKDTVKRPYKILHGHIFVHLFWEEGKWGCEGQMPSFGPPQLRHCKLAGLAAGKSRVEQSRYLYLPKYCVNILYFLNWCLLGVRARASKESKHVLGTKALLSPLRSATAASRVNTGMAFFVKPRFGNIFFV